MSSHRPLSVNFTNIEVMFKKDQRSEVKDFFNEKRLNIALDNKFSIMEDTVFLYDLTIGKYKDGKCMVRPLFKQELSDLVKRNDFPLSVEISNGNSK